MVTNLSLSTSVLVKRDTVSMVLPAFASTTCTGMVGTLGVGVAVAAGEATTVGVPLPTVAVALGCVVAVAAGVLVPLVAVACFTAVVGTAVGVAEVFERSAVLGILFRTFWISAGVGVGPAWKFVMLSTLFFLLFADRSSTCTVN